MKKHLAQIERIRSSRILPVTTGDGLRLPSTEVLPTKVHGLYWIYTSYSIEQIENCTPSQQDNAVDISALAKQHKGLSLVHNINHCGFNLVYNGIGGSSSGLRERIQGEFNGGEGTGSLGILKSSLNNLDNWRISYVILKNDKITPDLDLEFKEYAAILERAWRLEYGWPILCRA